MNCSCRLCALRKTRDTNSNHRFLPRQSTLPVYLEIPETEFGDEQIPVPHWSQVLSEPHRPRCYSVGSKLIVKNEEPPSDLRRMTLADPTDVRKPRSYKNKDHKRNSWDINSTDNASESGLLYTCALSPKIGQISASAGDIQITHSPPTPDHSQTSSISDVQTSGNTSIGDISIRSAPTPPVYGSGLSSRNSSPSSSTECSPEIRRRQWHSRILNIKDDLEKVCRKVKNAKDSVDEWRAKRSSKSLNKSKSTSESGETRVIRVEHCEMKRPHNQRSMYKHYKQYSKKGADDEDEFDFPDHNISPALVLTSLQDCMFTAEVNMIDLPNGDITLRISGYRVIIIINRKKSKGIEDSHRIIKPFRYGEIDIPIYVDPTTLSFQYEEDFNKLRLQGKMKGHEKKKYSLSNDDLRVMKSPSNNNNKHRLSHSHLHHDAVSEEHLTEAKPDDQTRLVTVAPPRKPSGKGVINMEAFRERAYTK